MLRPRASVLGALCSAVLFELAVIRLNPPCPAGQLRSILLRYLQIVCSPVFRVSMLRRIYTKRPVLRERNRKIKIRPSVSNGFLATLSRAYNRCRSAGLARLLPPQPLRALPVEMRRTIP